VCTQNGQGQGKVADSGFEAGDNGRLGKRVGVVFERNVGVEWGIANNLYTAHLSQCRALRKISSRTRLESFHLGNMVVEPLSALLPNYATVVPIVVACHVSEDVVHSLGRNIRKERLYEILMSHIGKVYKPFVNIASG
jgi:hypothetical protein